MTNLLKYVFLLLKNITLLSYCICLSWIPISYIFGSLLCSKLTLLQGSYMAIWTTSFIGKIFSVYTLLLSGKTLSSVLYKLPSISSIIMYFLLQQNKRIFYFLYALFMTTLLVLFVGIFKQTIWYTTAWIFCIIYALAKTYTCDANSFDIIFFATWAGQAMGSVSYGLLKGFLTSDLYIATIPIVFLERSLFIFTHYLTLHIITFTNKLYNRIQENLIEKTQKVQNEQ